MTDFGQKISPPRGTPMTDHGKSDEPLVECPACKGRGYRRCGCWPGDCICGLDDQDCENCGGDGWVWPDEYEDLVNG